MFAALQHAASFRCLVEHWTDCEELQPKPKEKWISVDKNLEAKKHRAELYAAASKYRCVRCGRSSKYMTTHGKPEGPRWLREHSQHKLKSWREKHFGGRDVMRRGDRSGYAGCRANPKWMNRCESVRMDTKEHGKM